MVDLIKKYRKMRGLTQEKLAELLGISTRQLQRVENREKEINMALFKRIVQVLEFSDSDIVDFIRERN